MSKPDDITIQPTDECELCGKTYAEHHQEPKLPWCDIDSKDLDVFTPVSRLPVQEPTKEEKCGYCGYMKNEHSGSWLGCVSADPTLQGYTYTPIGQTQTDLWQEFWDDVRAFDYKGKWILVRREDKTKTE